jgi:hypothetical protein
MPSKDNSQYAPSAWGQRDFEFELPSGDKCLLRKVDPMQLIGAGILDKLDFATNVVMGTHVKNAQMSNVERIKRERAKREAKARGEDPAKAAQEVDDMAALQSLKSNPEQLAGFQDVLDQMLLLGVVAPKMVEAPEDDDDRVDGVFYTDTVPFNDKLAIFNKLMAGVKVVEQFRDGAKEAVGDVAPEPSVRPAAKRAPRTPRKRSAS